MQKIIITAIGVICLGGGFTNAEDVAVAFDGPGNKSVNAYITNKVNENKEAQKISAPQVVEKSSVEDVVNPYKNQFVVVKDLLKDLSAKDRMEFMSSIRLINGRVASQGYAVLKRNGVSRARVDEILLAFESSDEAVRSFRPAVIRPMVEVGELFQGVPEKAKQDFFDNMKFLNGGVASARTGLLERSVTPEKMNEILNAFMPLSDSGKGLHKDEACEAWIHNDEKVIDRECNPEPKYKCNPSVCK